MTTPRITLALFQNRASESFHFVFSTYFKSWINSDLRHIEMTEFTL